MTTVISRPNFARARDAALDLLKRFDITLPPVDPTDISRRLGVNVFFVEFDFSAQNISGFYDFEENAIFVNQNEYPLRQTFTVAHELGHKILHEEWAQSSEYKLLLRDQSGSVTDAREREANAFAAHLIVPRFMLIRYWQTMSVEDLSILFAVSVPVIKHRLAFEFGA